MKLIFDIGFNVGDFTRVCFAKHSDVNVVAVEANPDLVNKMPNDLFFKENLILINNLVADKDGIDTDFYISPVATGISTASENFMKNSRFGKGSKYITEILNYWRPPIKIKSITIDSLIKEYGLPDLIKIDVEGYELNVIHGLTQKAKDICFEWHEEAAEDLYQIISYLEKLGYNQFGVIGYFEEGDIFSKATFSDKGDPYLEYPKNFYKIEELELEKLINSERRINYGMFFAK